VARRFLNVASTLKIILVVGGIFVAGAVTGGVVSLRVADHLVRQKRVIERIGPTEIGSRLAEQLRLTPTQKEKIRPIITRTSEELRKLRREAFARTAALITQMDADLSEELTPEQRVLLKDVRAKEEERRKRWMAERAKRNESRPPEGPGGDGQRAPIPPPEP
jgi:Spy/CpxP family protein refolding chaperone